MANPYRDSKGRFASKGSGGARKGRWTGVSNVARFGPHLMVADMPNLPAGGPPEEMELASKRRFKRPVANPISKTRARGARRERKAAEQEARLQDAVKAFNNASGTVRRPRKHRGPFAPR